MAAGDCSPTRRPGARASCGRRPAGSGREHAPAGPGTRGPRCSGGPSGGEGRSRIATTSRDPRPCSPGGRGPIPRLLSCGGRWLGGRSSTHSTVAYGQARTVLPGHRLLAVLAFCDTCPPVVGAGDTARSSRAHHPAQGGGADHPPRCRPVEPDTSRGVRPARRRLIGANPRPGIWPGPIPVFDPMAASMRRARARGSDAPGRAGRPRCSPGLPAGERVQEAGDGEAPCREGGGAAAAEGVEIPAAGARAGRPARSTRPAWGAPDAATRRDRASDHARVPGGSPRDAKSSTMRGPRGLAGERDRRRCRTATGRRRRVRGRFCLRAPEIAGAVASGGPRANCRPRERGRARRRHGGADPPSDVTDRAEAAANPGTAAAAGLVTGARAGRPGD